MCDDCIECTETVDDSCDMSSDVSCDTSMDMGADYKTELQDDIEDISNDGSDDLPDASFEDAENLTGEEQQEVEVKDLCFTNECASENANDLNDSFDDDSCDELDGDDWEGFEDGSEDLLDGMDDPAIFDETGNLRVMDNEEYLSLSPEQQEQFEQRFDALSQEDQDLYRKQFAQADLERYKSAVNNGEIEQDDRTEQELNDIIDGKYQGDDDFSSTLTEYCAAAGMSAVGTSIGLDPLTKAELTSQAGDIGRLYGSDAMEKIARTAYVQNGIHTPVPIVHIDANGNKSFDYGDVGDVSKQKLMNDTLSDSYLDWDNRITDNIANNEQLDIYRRADLEQVEINGRPCLIKDIDYDYIDEKTGMTNRELMAKGRSPIDAKTNERIELHHMGQNFDSPFAELTENSEHGDGNHKILHPKNVNSWRNDNELKKEYQKEKMNHWITRSKECKNEVKIYS